MPSPLPFEITDMNQIEAQSSLQSRMPTMITILAAIYVPLAFVTVRTLIGVHLRLSKKSCLVIPRDEYQPGVCFQLAPEFSVRPIRQQQQQ